MKLHVIYKGQTVDISYDLLYINTDEVNIRFYNSNAQSCKFLTQYLEANRLDYVLKNREDYKEIVTLPDVFALTLSTKGTYRSPVVKDNLYDAIIKRSNDIELTHNAIREFKRNVKIIDAKLVDMQDDLSKSEYARSIDNITKEILEFKRCKQLEALALTEEHLVFHVKQCRQLRRWKWLMRYRLCSNLKTLRSFYIFTSIWKINRNCLRNIRRYMIH